VRCAICEEGYGSSGSYCVTCGSNVVNWLLLCLFCTVVGCFGTFAVYRAVRKGQQPSSKSTEQERLTLTTVKVLISYLQLVSFLKDFNLLWPPIIANMFSVSGSVSSLPLGSSFVSCTLGWSFFAKLTFFLVLPLASVLVPLACVLLRMLCRRAWSVDWYVWD
jgi:hypothetical protein